MYAYGLKKAVKQENRKKDQWTPRFLSEEILILHDMLYMQSALWLTAIHYL